MNSISFSSVSVRVPVDGSDVPKTLLQDISLDLTERRIGGGRR